MAKLWLRKLSEVSEVARELLRLVGAEREELRAGITGPSVGRFRRLAEAKEVGRELFLLVGAEEEDFWSEMEVRCVERLLVSAS